MAELSAERVQTDEAELSESLIEQILNDDDLQDDVNLAVTIGVLPAEFAVKENQPTRLNGDILAEEAAWATLANEADVTEDQQEKNEENDITETFKPNSPRASRDASLDEIYLHQAEEKESKQEESAKNPQVKFIEQN